MAKLGPKQASKIGNATAIEIRNFLQHDHGVEMTHATTADRAVEIHPEIAEFAIATAQGEIHWFIVNSICRAMFGSSCCANFLTASWRAFCCSVRLKSMMWSVLSVDDGQSAGLHCIGPL